MIPEDGREVARDVELRVDVVVVGSGPAGSAVARVLARAGVRVLVLEAGPRVDPGEHDVRAFRAMGRLYRSMGASIVAGPAPMPFVQGRMVGGSAAVNGAICWRLPRDVHEEWLAADPGLEETLGWDDVERLTDEVEDRLRVRPTAPEVAGRKNALLARGAEALGLEHRPIRRNVSGCEGLGRCLQGCPAGHKRSPERSLLPDALTAGGRLMHDVSVRRILTRGGRAVGVEARARGGGRVTVRADRVVLAASAVQTPILLLRSGIRQGPVGHHFQCHPGVSMTGRYPEPVRAWEGATQGHEVIGLRREGLKFEALGMGVGVFAGRMEGVGRALAREVEDLAHWVDWGVAIRSRTHGRVRLVAGRTVVTWGASADDLRLFRRGLRVLGELHLAAGAERVGPHVKGLPAHLTSLGEVHALEADAPRRASAYTGAITHMFGTCRMGVDPAASVVGPDFQHHAVEGLYVADSSVFPSNIGVNPQIAIMAIAARCGELLTA